MRQLEAKCEFDVGAVWLLEYVALGFKTLTLTQKQRCHRF
jgi:hypothetical protein